MFESGLKASELIAELNKMIETYGDLEVISGGGDYPEGVRGVSYNKKSEPYYPANSFVIR